MTYILQYSAWTANLPGLLVDLMDWMRTGRPVREHRGMAGGNGIGWEERGGAWAWACMILIVRQRWLSRRPCDASPSLRLTHWHT